MLFCLQSNSPTFVISTDDEVEPSCGRLSPQAKIPSEVEGDPQETEAEWRDPEDVSSAMPCQGVLTILLFICIVSGNTIPQAPAGACPERSRRARHICLGVLESVALEADTLSHTCFQNVMHIVFSTKNRRKIIPAQMKERLWAYTAGIC